MSGKEGKKKDTASSFVFLQSKKTLSSPLSSSPSSPFFRGKYGVVFKCEGKAGNTPHALKLMLKRGNKKEDVQREVAILKKISAHPGVLSISDFVECPAEYILVTEL